MRLVRQASKIEIINFADSDKHKVRYSPNVPNNIRAIVCGPSNAGKTFDLISLLLSENSPLFLNSYLYSTTLFQDIYDYYRYVLTGIEDFGYFESPNCDDVVKLSQAKPFSVALFDDVSGEDKSVINEYFTHGRHYNQSCFFLCQCYTCSDKHAIRNNAKYLAIFRQDKLNLFNLYKNHIIGYMAFKQFVDMCSFA